MPLKRLDHKTWSLISPTVARIFRVIPLERDGNRIRMLTDRRLTDDERRQTESRLSLRLRGKVVHLQALEAQADWKQSEFQDALERYYTTDSGRMTVLLVDPVVTRARSYGHDMKLCGQAILHARTLDEAKKVAAFPQSKVDMVLIADELEAGFNRAKRSLQKLVRVPVLALSQVNLEPPMAARRGSTRSTPRNGESAGKNAQ